MNDACLLAEVHVFLSYWTGLIVLGLLSIGLIAWLADWALTYALRVTKLYWRFLEFAARKGAK
ncbi:MAG TPA: hypothetical protein VGE09_08390 [Pseudoxanthomonas sp.]